VEELRLSAHESIGSAALEGVARAARERLSAELAALDDTVRALLKRIPLERAAAAIAAYPADRDYMALGRPAERLFATVQATGDEASAARYGHLLLLHLLGDVPSRSPAMAIPGELGPFVAAGLEGLLDAATPRAWNDGEYQKDLAVALLRALPNDGIVLIAIRKRARNLLRRARVAERLAVASDLGLAGYVRRAWFLNIHQWRGTERWKRDPGEPRVLRTAAVFERNPRLAGVIHSGWINDPALESISPAIAARAAIYLGAGGHRFRMANSRATTALALATSNTRRRLYEEGTYRPANYGIILRREKLLAWAENQAAAAGGAGG
jgi:hypothetical protein